LAGSPVNPRGSVLTDATCPGGVLPWEVARRSQMGLASSFLEELWSRNLGHVTPVASPLVRHARGSWCQQWSACRSDPDVTGPRLRQVGDTNALLAAAG
jgi:hypothetical protein